MKTLIHLFAFLLPIINCNLTFGQLANYAVENKIWHEGTIKLENGQTIEGELNYNFITEILSYRSNGESHPYTARNVVSFILKDHNSNSRRKYYSIPISDPGEKFEKLVFFEVIYERGSLAILSRHFYKYQEREKTAIDPVSGMPISYGRTSKEKIKEYLYLADDRGHIIAYAKKIKDKNSFDTYASQAAIVGEDVSQEAVFESKTTRSSDIRYQIVNSSAIEQITGAYFTEIEKFSKSNRYKLNTIDELIMFVDYYDSISK